MRRADVVAFGALYAALAIGLFLLNGWNAYHPTDDGFLIAYGWRVAHGEVPYRDFIYVRPPLSPYIAAALVALPEGWTIQAGRLLFYVELAASGLLPTLWAVRRRGLRASPRTLALAAITFLFAAHNFPPMPWPTADGVLFGAAAVTAFLLSLEGGSGSRAAWRAAASVLVALAVLAKQTFAPLPLLLVAYVLVEAARSRESRIRLASASLLPGAIVAVATLGALAATGALTAFAQQIGTPTQVRPTADAPWSGDLWTVGVAPYLATLVITPLTGMAMLVVFGLAWSRDAEGPLAATLRAVGPLGLVAALAAFGVEMLLSRFDPGRQVFWLLVAALAAEALAVARGRRRPADLAAWIGLLALGWASSLSFAYQTPALGLAATAPLFAFALPPVARVAERAALALATATLLVSVLLLDVERPYRELPRGQQVADLGSAFPRFGHLYTNAANYERMAELRDLSRRFALSRGRAFVVMPDYPLVYFLSDARNPLSIDWFEPWEYLGNEARLLREMEERRPVVLLERDPSLLVGAPDAAPAPCDRPAGLETPLVRDVVSRWALLAQGAHFCVYVAPSSVNSGTVDPAASGPQ